MLNDGIVFNDVGGGASSTSIYQTGITCSITNNFNNGSVRLNTKMEVEFHKIMYMH